MAVEIHIHLPLWPADRRDQELDLGGRPVRVRELVANLGVNPEHVGFVTIDGQPCEDDTIVPETCRLCIFGLLSGGQEQAMAEHESRCIPVASLTEACVHLLQQVGVPAEQAALIADACVQADLRGVESHGVLRLPAYIHQVTHGLLAADTRVTVVRDHKAMALLDGNGGFGQVAAAEGMRMAIRKAKEYGLGAVGVRNAGHFGMAAYYAMMALPHDAIGIVISNAAPSMAPWGGIDAILGSNPLCVAIPTGTDTPIVLDMATTIVARGKIRLAAEKGERIPATWALDSSGQPTEDAAAALKGTLLPVGGPKGYGLSLVNDVLAGVLTGAPFGSSIPSVHDTTRPSAVGFYMQAIDIQSYLPLDSFYARIQQLIAEIKGCRCAEGVSRIYLPGEPELERARERLANGIPVPAPVLRSLGELAAGLGITLPL